VKRAVYCDFLPALLALVSVSACAEVPISKVRVINTFPHDPDAFTQGLVVYER